MAVRIKGKIGGRIVIDEKIRNIRREIERIEPYGSEDVAMAYA